MSNRTVYGLIVDMSEPAADIEQLLAVMADKIRAADFANVTRVITTLDQPLDIDERLQDAERTRPEIRLVDQ